MSVVVLDKRKRPLMPCSEKRARLLLDAGRARVHRLVPFTIRLVDRRVEDSACQPLRLSLDPGSKVSGLAVSRVEPTSEGPVLHLSVLMELVHRGQAIRDALQQRASFRRRRRGANLRYRSPRFLNRGGDRKGWLTPSLMPELAQELVRFDMQLLQAKAEGRTIEGVDYQRGTLFGFEVGEYLLAKWGRACAYCGANDVPLEKDHSHPQASGGSNRVSNLTLACRPCNQKKGKQDVRAFLANDPKRLSRILAQAKAPLKDAAAVNATRWKLHSELCRTGLPVETGSGGLTKFNRVRLDIPKTHALDAACVGQIAAVRKTEQPTLRVKATGRGNRIRTRLDRYGFPRGYLMREKSVFGFRTGDRVRAEVPKGKHQGVHVGRVAVRKTGSFNLQTAQGVLQGISHRHCRVLQRGDGYSYHIAQRKESGFRDALSLPGRKAEVSRGN